MKLVMCFYISYTSLLLTIVHSHCCRMLGALEAEGRFRGIIMGERPSKLENRDDSSPLKNKRVELNHTLSKIYCPSDVNPLGVKNRVSCLAQKIFFPQPQCITTPANCLSTQMNLKFKFL